MRLRILPLIGITCIFAIVVQAQTTQPSGESEWFIGVESTQTTRGGNMPQRRCVRYDADLGAKQTLWIRDSRMFPKASLIDNSGHHLKLESIKPSEHFAHGRVKAVVSEPGKPYQVFEKLNVSSHWNMALSPDGKKIVLTDAEKGQLVMANGENIYETQTDWWITRDFSWSPDSTKVAFYYALNAMGDDLYSEKHGVAVFGIDGDLRVLLKASDAIGTPRNGVAKNIPPGWDPSGHFLYFTDGKRPDDSQWPQEAIDALHRNVSCTYRVDLRTGEIEALSLGDFMDIAPDGKYILISRNPRPGDSGQWETGTTQLMLPTREAHYLPKTITGPRISPSGKLVACTGPNFTVCFYRTSDWKLSGQPIPRKTKKGTGGGNWFTDCRWIVVDEQSPFYEPQSQPAP